MKDEGDVGVVERLFEGARFAVLVFQLNFWRDIANLERVIGGVRGSLRGPDLRDGKEGERHDCREQLEGMSESSHTQG